MEKELSYITAMDRSADRHSRSGAIYQAMKTIDYSESRVNPSSLRKLSNPDVHTDVSLRRNNPSGSPKAYVIAVQDTLENLFDSFVNLDTREKMSSLLSFCSPEKKAEPESKDLRFTMPGDTRSDGISKGQVSSRREQITDLLKELISPEKVGPSLLSALPADLKALKTNVPGQDISSKNSAVKPDKSPREAFLKMIQSIDSEADFEEIHREEISQVREKNEIVARQIGEASKQAATSIESILKKSMKECWVGDEMAAKLIYMLMKASSSFTFEHSSRVIDLSVELARQMGITDEKELKELKEGAMFHDIGEVELDLEDAPQSVKDRLARYLTAIDLRNCSFLHDIGKVRIPDSILYKPGRLTDEEYEVLKQHPIIGEQILKPIPAMAHVLPVVRHHHEAWSGKGYPDGLAGEAIPLAARIVSITDAFDAMISDRPYRKGMPVEKAVEELKKNAGTQFDPALAEAFLKVIERKFSR